MKSYNDVHVLVISELYLFYLSYLFIYMDNRYY